MRSAAPHRNFREETRLIFVVLGMHKSGTTLVSQILHHSGIDMGAFDEGVSYDDGNKYERAGPLALNQELLGAKDDKVLDLARPARLAPSGEQRARMRAIVAEASDRYEHWGFKDPRTCLTYGAWAEELPPHRIIAVYRDPAQVWPRFRWAGKGRYHTNFRRAYSYLCRWQEHNLEILRHLQQTTNDYVVLSYHDFMTSEREWRRLVDFVGLPLDDRRRPDLYRSRSEGDLFFRTASGLLRRRRGLDASSTLCALDELRI